MGVAICIKLAEAWNEAGYLHGQYTIPDRCPWYRVTKYLETLRVARWRDTAAMNCSFLQRIRKSFRHALNESRRRELFRSSLAGQPLATPTASGKATAEGSE